MLNVAILSSHRAPALDALRQHPLCGVSFEINCVLRRRPPLEAKLRHSYDRETAAMLRHFGPDVVLLLGYLYFITEPLLSAFPERILNVHDGLPKYPGLHATRDAIKAGERETYSIVHEVTRDLDRGPVLVKSAPFPVATFALDAAILGQEDIVRAYAYAHREWMMRRMWPDLIVAAFEEITVRQEAMA